jgi:MFS transporter, MCT family, solute carrier family 16 (monocarboxylic acid transporters), member 10
LSATKSSLTLSLLNGASVVGRLVAGQLSDIFDPWLLALSTLMGSCLSTFVLWGVLSHTFGGLVAFSLAYGSLAGGWSSLWTGFIKDLPRKHHVWSSLLAWVGYQNHSDHSSGDDPQLSTTIIGYLMLSRGLGNILSTPISTALSHPSQNASAHADIGFQVGGGRFENVIVYSGVCFAGAALIAGIGWGVDRTRSRRQEDA